MPTRLEVTINAQDTASATLDSVRNNEAGSRSFGEFDLSASKAARGERDARTHTMTSITEIPCWIAAEPR